MAIALPPRLSGTARARINIRVSHFCPHPDLKTKQGVDSVRILWWGLDNPEPIRIPKNVDSKIVTFEVVTAENLFRNYLEDAEKLFFEVLVDDSRIGFSVVDNLVNIVDQKGISRSLEVFDDRGQVWGEIQVQIDLEHLNDDDGEPADLDHATKPCSSSSVSKNSKAIYRPPSKKLTTPVRQGKVLTSKSKKDTDGHTLDRPKVAFSDAEIRPRWNQPQNGTQDLQRVLLRSRQRVTEDFGKAPKRSHPTPVRSVRSPSEKENVVTTSETSTTTITAPNPTEAAGKNGLLPAWNLSTSRLRFLSTVTQVVVNVKSVALNYNIFRIVQEDAKRQRQVLRSRNGPSTSRAPFMPHQTPPLSYFVSFTVPPGTLATNFCSRKISDRNEIIFNQKHTQPLIFKPELLDTWWTTELTIKFLSRSMKQRVPSVLGQASIGLKYLLTDARNSSGNVLKLPIYASQKFVMDNKLESEIIGDLHISFLLHRGPTSSSESEGKDTFGYKISPQRAVRDGDMDDQTTSDPAQDVELSSPSESAIPVNFKSVAVQVEKSVDPDDSEHIYDSVHSVSTDSGSLDPQSGQSTIIIPQPRQNVGSSTSKQAESRKSVLVQVTIEEARNLPRVFDTTRGEKTLPSTFVTFTSVHNRHTSSIVAKSSTPSWKYQVATTLSTSIFTDPKRFFIIKLWHHDSKTKSTPDFQHDHVLGFVAVDLSPLVSGFPQIKGWYNIMDFVGRCRGQMKVTIVPLQKLSKDLYPRRDSDSSISSKRRDEEYIVSARYDSFPSHVVQHSEQIISPSPVFDRSMTTPLESDILEEARDIIRQVDILHETVTRSKSPVQEELRVESVKEPSWKPADPSLIPEDVCTKSFLQSKLTGLEEMTEEFKRKLTYDSQASSLCACDAFANE